MIWVRRTGNCYPLLLSLKVYVCYIVYSLLLSHENWFLCSPKLLLFFEKFFTLPFHIYWINKVTIIQNNLKTSDWGSLTDTLLKMLLESGLPVNSLLVSVYFLHVLRWVIPNFRWYYQINVMWRWNVSLSPVSQYVYFISSCSQLLVFCTLYS